MDAKLKDIILIIQDKTNQKLVNWNKLGSSETYYVKLNNGSLLIDRSASPTSGITYRLSIVNENGDSVMNSLLKKGTNSSEQDIKDYNLVRELYLSARRAYLKVDETLEGLFNEISKSGDKPIGMDEGLPF